MQLVQGRECGECTVCCSTPLIDSPDFYKGPSVRCQHLFADKPGCTIHANVYSVCREFFCGWRYLPALGEAWRPDRIGFMIAFEMKNLPAHYPKRPGVRFILCGGQEAALNPDFLDQVAQLIAKDVPVLLTMQGPPGYYPQSAFLNDALKEPVAQRDLAAVQNVISEALKAVALREFERAPDARETGAGANGNGRA